MFKIRSLYTKATRELVISREKRKEYQKNCNLLQVNKLDDQSSAEDVS